MVRARSIRKLTGLILAGIVSAGLIFHTAFNIYAAHKVAEEIRKIEVKGEPVWYSDIVGPSVADEQNAALIYQEVFSLLHANKDELDRVKKVSWRNDVSKWTEEDKEEIPGILAKHREIFELLHEASLKPASSFSLDSSVDTQLLVSYSTSLMDCVKLLSVKSTLEKEDGQIPKATERILDGFAVARACGNDMILPGAIGRIVCAGILVDSIKSVLADREIPLEDYRRMYESLREESEARFIDFLIADRCFWISRLKENPKQMIRQNFKDAIRIFEVLKNHPPSFWEKAKCWYPGSYLNRPFYKLERVHHLRKQAKTIEVLRKPYWEIKDEDLPKSIFPYGKKGLLQEPAMVRADLGTAKLGIALRMYKNKNGNYPVSLKELVPSIVEELPVDPFTGKDFVYRQEKNGFIVYSLGENARDDGAEGDDVAWRFQN